MADRPEADDHYYEYLSKCACYPDSESNCSFPGSLDLSRSFASLPENERISVIRGILLALAAPPGNANELMARSGKNKKRSRDFSESENNKGYATVKYAIKGKSLCRMVFCAITQVSVRTVSRHASEVAKSSTVSCYTTNRSQSRSGIESLQTLIAISFLEKYSEDFGLPCSMGFGSHSVETTRWLSSGIQKKDVYETYTNQWTYLKDAIEFDH